MNKPRTFTILTVDHGPVTLTCPEWCTSEHAPNGHRVDITHVGDVRRLTLPVRGAYAELLTVSLEARPFTEAWPGTAPFVSVGFNDGHHPSSVYRLEVMAGQLERHAEELRDAARRLAVILAEGEGR
ncbi:DUF6907 domain-containing protein [Streptomyces sp. NY05-11A]|uniref:DUF6907 domain-containing protein n=1 Tax=Streptomyces soliscabiei TaxID=588897 RepID=UPI0029B9EC9D|nr:hypothetical protein [Streptomyces sp. NY05-11A]MDX2676191.1 hypothetical protein [Streptomyces sp. NY05-11A]